MAHQQYLLEKLFDLIGVLADKLGQGGEVRVRRCRAGVALGS
jgi:hypothetical protein